MKQIPFDSTQVFIGGQWRAGANSQTLPLANPSDGSELTRIARGNAEDVDAAVNAARVALDGAWGALSAVERGRVLLKMSARVLEQADELARLEALDVGKPLKQARADAVALARYLEFYGGAADKVHGQTIPFANGYTALTLREAHGVTAHIVPWNYPMQIIGRSVGAALAMGNACVLQAGRRSLPDGTGLRPHRCTRPACRRGRLNVVPGSGRRSRRSALALHTPGMQPHFIHRLGCRGRADPGRGGAAHAVPVTLELGGKSPQTRRLRRCRPRCRAAFSRQRRYPECRADLLGGDHASWSNAQGLRRGGAAHGRALPRAAASGRRWTICDVGPLISARQRQIVDGLPRCASKAERPARSRHRATLAAGHCRRGGFYIAADAAWPPVEHRTTALRRTRSSARCRR